MNEHRTRPAAGPSATPIEVELTGGDAGPSPTVAGDAPPPDWRRVVAIGSVAGAALGIALGAVMLADDADDGSAATTLDDPEITTPPTLPPLEVLPGPEFTRKTVSTAPRATSSQDRSLFDPGTVPTYPPVRLLGGLDRFDLSGSVAGLDDDIPRRSTTSASFGRFELDVRITRDPVADRYEIVLVGGGVVQRLIVDVAGGWSYRGDMRDEWVRIDNDLFADSIGVPDMATFVESLMFGPVRPDTLGDAVLDPGSLVDLGGGLVAREFGVTLAAGAIPEWARYVFGPWGGDVTPPPPEQELDYSVYVTSEGNVRRVVGAMPYEAMHQLVVHDLVRLTNPVAIEIPSPDSVRDLVEPERI